MHLPRFKFDQRLWLAIAAAAAPSLLAYNVAPSPTFLNQALAVGLWGWFVVGVAAAPPRRAGRGLAAVPLQAALALVTLSVLWSWLPGALPAGLALSGIGLLLAAGVLVASGAGAHDRADPARAFGDFCVGWAVAGGLNVIVAVAQVFAADRLEGAWGDWIAHSGLPGRAVGNLRQPNHLSSLLLWAAIATAALAELGRLGRRGTAVLYALLVFAVVLSASRTGLLGVLLLAGWGAADRRLLRSTRALLLAGPLVYAACWFGMAEWANLAQQTFGGQVRLAEPDLSASRFAIWRDTLALIASQPWAGVGFGEFNFAWTLTPFPHRPVAFFDHTHNLPLQLAAELGLPLGTAVMALLLWGLWRAVKLAFPVGTGSADAAAMPPDQRAALGSCRRSAVMMVLMIGLHSLLEYPLWYSYFLLPAAWAWAFALGTPAAPLPAAAGRQSVALMAAGAAVALGAVLSALDYRSVTAIFVADASAPPLSERIARGQRSVLFAHHADYAAATTDVALADPLQPFVRATHYLLDTRLMLAWAKALDASGDTDAARFIAARLREFHNPASDEFFADCMPAASSPQPAVAIAASAPFQCQPPPPRQRDWRQFERR